MWLAITIDGVPPAGLQMQDGQISLGPAGLAMGASGPTATPPSTSVTASARGYLAPTGVTSITLSGSAQTVTGNDAGDSFIVSNNSANHIYGGAGNDTFILGRGGDVATGGGGADRYVFNETPWAAGHITDFDPGHDLIDLSGLLARSGYSGADPIHAGYIKLTADAAGQAQIWSNLGPIANAGWWLVTTLDGVSVSDVAMLGDYVTVNPNATVSKASYTAPDGVTAIHLTGANQTIHANNGGDTIWSDDTHNTLIGGTGNDTFHIGRAGDTVTGGGGNDTFAYAEVPWGGSHITDFQSGDVIDLTGLMQTTHDTGSDGFADGYLRIASDSSGNAQISANYNLPGNDSWWVVATLDHVAASSLHTHGAFVTG
jgi:Ca2+-binding RTX toxin-like protein